MSGWEVSCEPTRNPSECPPSRRTVAASRMPDSATTTAPSGARSARRAERSRSMERSWRFRWFTPKILAPNFAARAASFSSMTSVSTSIRSDFATEARCVYSSSDSTDSINSTASAPK